MGIKTHVKPFAKIWHVSVSGRFWILGVMFQGARFSIRWNQRKSTTKTWHIFVSVCSRACTACVWKPASGHLQMSDKFMTLHWNNVEGVKGLPIYSCGSGEGGLFFWNCVWCAKWTIHYSFSTWYWTLDFPCKLFFSPFQGGQVKAKSFQVLNMFPKKFPISPHTYPICFGKCCSPLIYIGGPKGTNFITQNITLCFGNLHNFIFLNDRLIKLAHCKKTSGTWEAPHLINAKHNMYGM